MHERRSEMMSKSLYPDPESPEMKKSLGDMVL